MEKYTVLDDPAADKAVQEVLDMVVEGIVDLMGVHVKAIVLMGGFGRGEGGIYNAVGDYKLVNDLDLVVFVEKNFRKVKKKYNAMLKRLAVELQPKARGIKQVDVDITNTWRYRFVPNLVNYYEIKHGHQVIYGDLDLDKIMPSLKAENLPVFDGTIYFYARGSGLLLPAVYFLTNNLGLPEIRENFQIELQKACQAMGDAVLLMAGQYHYSYRERLRRFDIIEKDNNIVPTALMAKVSPLYRWGVECKLRPSFEWSGAEDMIKKWYDVKDVFSDFFLWFESKRLNELFVNWTEYSNYLETKGPSEPWDIRLKELLKNVLQKKGLNCQTKRARLLPILPLLVFGLDRNGKCRQEYLERAWKLLTPDDEQKTWLAAVRAYLNKFHPGGVVEKALKM